MKYFYEKRFRRPDGTVFVKQYSRSFPLDVDISELPRTGQSNSKEASVSRAKSKLHLLAFHNPQLIGMLTLTFKENLDDEVEAQRRFDLFRRAVSRDYKSFQFLGVKEFQKRGAIHYHLLVNFCPGQIHSPLWDSPNQQQSSYWTEGISDFRLIQGDNTWRTELYLLKYLGKDKFKPFKQYYVRSRNLNRISDPVYFPSREPIHFLADQTTIFRQFIHTPGTLPFDSFSILTYTYNVKQFYKENINGAKTINQPRL